MKKVISKDGTMIAFDRLGQGQPLIFVGPALADRSVGTPLCAVLAEHFTVFNYDRRGRGDSGDSAPYSVEREVEDIDALIKEAGGSVFLVGGSVGAVLALEATAHGLAIRKLAMYEPPFILDDSRPSLPADYVAQISELISAGRRGDAVELFLTKAVGIPVQNVTEMRTAPMWTAFEAIAHTLAYDGTIMGDTMSGNPLSINQWASVTVPTLVIDGGESPKYQKNAVRALAAILPSAQHRTLEGQDHAVDPKVLAPVLKEFFTN